jgi:hypothetical protein
MPYSWYIKRYADDADYCANEDAKTVTAVECWKNGMLKSSFYVCAVYV